MPQADAGTIVRIQLDECQALLDSEHWYSQALNAIRAAIDDTCGIGLNLAGAAECLSKRANAKSIRFFYARKHQTKRGQCELEVGYEGWKLQV